MRIYRARVPKIPEKQIVESILQWVNYQPNTWAWKNDVRANYDPRRGRFLTLDKWIVPGGSDILGITYGRFLALEVKTPTTIKRYFNRPTERDMKQREFLARIVKLGGIGQCVSSLEDVVLLFTEIQRSH